MKRIAATLFIALAITGCKKTQSTADTSAATKPAEPTYYKVDTGTAGTITGTVRYQGPAARPKLIDMSSDPACAKTHKGGKMLDESLVVDKQGRVANSFVYISKGLEGKTFETPSAAVTIDQSGCWFKPRVLGLQTGQTLDITNSDPVTHNIHTMPRDSREWNHSQGPGDPVMHHKFTKAEVMIPVKCNIHDWMHAYVGVVDHPYFAVTGDDGSFKLPNVPPGNYTVSVWHEDLPVQTIDVTVPASKNVEANLTLHAN